MSPRDPWLTVIRNCMAEGRRTYVNSRVYCSLVVIQLVDQQLSTIKLKPANRDDKLLFTFFTVALPTNKYTRYRSQARYKFNAIQRRLAFINTVANTKLATSLAFV